MNRTPAPPNSDWRAAFSISQRLGVINRVFRKLRGKPVLIINQRSLLSCCPLKISSLYVARQLFLTSYDLIELWNAGIRDQVVQTKSEQCEGIAFRTAATKHDYLQTLATIISGYGERSRSHIQQEQQFSSNSNASNSQNKFLVAVDGTVQQQVSFKTPFLFLHLPRVSSPVIIQISIIN